MGEFGPAFHEQVDNFEQNVKEVFEGDERARTEVSDFLSKADPDYRRSVFDEMDQRHAEDPALHPVEIMDSESDGYDVDAKMIDASGHSKAEHLGPGGIETHGTESMSKQHDQVRKEAAVVQEKQENKPAWHPSSIRDNWVGTPLTNINGDFPEKVEYAVGLGDPEEDGVLVK